MWLLLFFLLLRPAVAHPLDDASLEIRTGKARLHVTWTVPASVSREELRLGDATLQIQSQTPLPSGHVRYVGTLDTTNLNFAYQAWPPRTTDVPRCLLVIHTDNKAVSAVLTPDNPSYQVQNRALSFFQLGIEHILTGPDHLLFLLVLLLPKTHFKTHLKTITAFTLAHSLTLSLAVLGVVSLPQKPVEIVIALSIAAAALCNLRPNDDTRRWPMAFGFGLIHGLGFAGALQERGVQGTDAALPLLSFNLGVETGQLLTLLVALPILWRIGPNRRFRTAVSLATALLALVWTWQRW